MPFSHASEEGNNLNAKQNNLRWRECLRLLDEGGDHFGEEGAELVRSVSEWDALSVAVGDKESGKAKSIAVFRSPDTCQVAFLESEVQQKVTLGPHFHIRPLLSEVVRDRTFYLLALSQKNSRLLRCTPHSSEEVTLPESVKSDFEVWMNQAKPDHTAVYNAMSSSAQGTSGPNALAPKGSDREGKDEYLSHYFKQIDRGVNEVLKGQTEPLVLCGVEYELPIYRDVNTYPHVAAEAVRGAPNGLKASEILARAIQALEVGYEKKVDEVLADWNHRVGGGASSRIKEIVTAAHEGRVLTLVLSDSQEQIGLFDEATHRVKGRKTGSRQDEDLVNDAAVQTILHAGNVLVAPRSKMPNGAPAAAIFRY